MAQKLPLLKLLQEIRGYAEAGNRSTEIRPLLAATAGFRSSKSPSKLPQRRFSIPVRHEQLPEECEIPVRQTAANDQPGPRVLRLSFE